MKKRYNYRAYPSTRQQRDLARLFGCVRYVYNSAIADRQMIFETGLHEITGPKPQDSTKSMKVFEVNRQAALITYARSRKPWLNQVSSVALIQSLRDAEQAFANFFASRTGKRKGPRVGFPRYKSRRAGRQSARFTSNGFRVDADRGRVYLAKIGWFDLAWSRDLPSSPSSATVTRNSDGTFEVSFVVEVEEVSVEYPADRHAAIDLGLGALGAVVYSDGTRERIENPRHLRAAERRLHRAQRELARKVGPDRRTGKRASTNWRKQSVKVARVHSAVRRTRQDFLRKLARRLASENTTIAVENLNIRGLAKSGGKNAQGRGLRRSIHDVAWAAFLARLSNNLGDRLYAVDPRHTSQTCSVCGALDRPKALEVRQWTCGECGAQLDRDFNAAVNILVAAGQVETQNACGGDMRLRLAGAVPAEAGTLWSASEMAA